MNIQITPTPELDVFIKEKNVGWEHFVITSNGVPVPDWLCVQRTYVNQDGVIGLVVAYEVIDNPVGKPYSRLVLHFGEVGLKELYPK
jgi:hypothetical protein